MAYQQHQQQQQQPQQNSAPDQQFLWSVFQKVDRDRSGHISGDELGQGGSHDQADDYETNNITT
jgi:Ca2+-binding EF-hand superfamily protein